MLTNSSTPSFSEFNPHDVPYQYRVLEDIHHFNYSLGVHEILLSGSVGSAKSILMAHYALKHCLTYSKARFLIGRRALPALRATLWTKIIEHMEGSLIEGYHYTLNRSRMEINFRNGSQIMCRSWADGNYLNLRSLELSGAAIEELTENDEEDSQAYMEIKMRVGRLPHIKENVIISASNPDAPSHWAYKYFIVPAEEGHETRHVYYSITSDNKFLPPQYIEQLKKDLDPKMARRMLYGEWIEIQGEVIYYEYDKTCQFIKSPYKPNPEHPIILAWDFNIGEGKPISMACLQFIDDKFHVFNEVVVHGGRTADTLDELEAKGILNPDFIFHITGDAAGKHRDTRSSRSDYDIILKELKAKNLRLDFRVPAANPPVRARHNKVNGYCKNDLGDVRLFIYQDAPTADEGFRLTKLKKGASYIEDDSKEYQHITTAIGYAICFETMMKDRKRGGVVRL